MVLMSSVHGDHGSHLISIFVPVSPGSFSGLFFLFMAGRGSCYLRKKKGRVSSASKGAFTRLEISKDPVVGQRVS